MNTRRKVFWLGFVCIVGMYLYFTIPNVALQYSRALPQDSINLHIIYDFGMFFFLPLVFWFIFYDSDLVKELWK